MRHPMKQTRALIALLFVVVTLASAVSVSLAATTPAKPAGVAQQGFSGVYIRSHRVNVTIDNQVAVTKVEQVFVNESQRPAEGTYLFPLPVGAAVSNLTMYINGQPVQAQLLDANQA